MNAVRPEAKRTLAATLLIGCAVMAGVDEIIFHQLLGWHHFYDGSTSAVALFSDGLLHSAELIALVAGCWCSWDGHLCPGSLIRLPLC